MQHETYRGRISETLARLNLTGFDARHVHAYMRVQCGTLGALDARQWETAVLNACAEISADGPEMAERVAASFWPRAADAVRGTADGIGAALEFARELCGALVGAHFDPSGYLERIESPRFDDAGYVHDWRHYVPDDTRRKWHEIDPAVRAAIITHAQALADAEEWD